jgi:putative PIN family toxin of toxin-antitoxin system
MDVVIDTNVWISALISKDGISREIIRLALLDKISPQKDINNEYINTKNP